MIISPSNIIEGLILMIKANQEEINSLIKVYRKTDELHLFKGMRKTLPESSFPSLEMEATSGSMEWVTTSAMNGEYSIDCTLTVNCGSDNEIGMEYICELTRKIVQIFNYPQNMSWIIPNEYADKNKTPVYCQYSDVRNAEYSSSKELGLRVARFQIACRVIESFPHPTNLIGPAKVNWKEDHIPGT